MRMQLIDHQIRLQLPSWWPRSLRPEALNQMDHPTPFLVCDLETARERYTHLTLALPGVHCFYGVKCNSEPELLAAFDQLGSSFEIASCAELQMLQKLGVDPEKVLYSNTVKPAAHIAESFAAGLWRYAFDSEGELYKLAQHAPGAAVYVRLRVDDSTSLFPLSRKFGAEAQEARALLLLARSLGLRPYGVTFHVGSQCTTTTAWPQAIAAVGRLLSQLSGDGITLEMLNLGGGFPARYVEAVPSVDQIANTIESALHELLPYRPPLLAVEPGRYLVAESSVLVGGVLGREVRAGENWAYLDVGAYNGLMETQQTVNQWRYPLWSSRHDHAAADQVPFTVTGPSCDSSDTTFFGVYLPATLDAGDRLYIGSAGAYTLSYASNFNGFPPPTPVFIGRS
jgi:ornithine decarboxylase